MECACKKASASQAMDLLLLAPDIQEAVLFLEAGTRVTERSLRTVVRHEDWREQHQGMGGHGRLDDAA